MSNKFDARQIIYRGTLNQIGNQTNPENDNLLNAINNQLTPLLRMSASSTPDLVVTIGGGDLTDSETNRRRAIPHIGTAYVQFSSGTVTFPAASGGNIVSSPGTNTVLTVGVGNYAAVLIYLDGSGNLNTIAGADSAVLNTAITNLPPSPDETLPLGFVIVQNVGGVIQNITQANIAQFGTGAGGGGAGNASTLDIVLRDRFANLGMKYLDPNIFRTAKSTKVDGASTGAFDLVKNAFKFTSIGQTMVSTNAANAEFRAEGVDITEVEFYVHWLLGFIDTAATYAVSRDGGTNWSTVTMSRVGTDSNAYRGYHVFADETVQQALQTIAASGAGDTLNATGNQQLSSQFVVSSTSVLRQVQLQLNYGAAGVGTFKLQLVKNNAGVPSTALADLLAESSNITINTLSSGNITVTVDMPDTVLVPGTYHLVMSTDAAYKAGTMDLSWRSGAGTNGATFNGTTWTGSASTKAYTAQGRAHDLRVRITAGTANTYLEGYGLYFGADDGVTAPNGTKNVQRFYFSGDENKTQFTLNWIPDPDLLEIYDPYRGQVYMIEEGVARLSGQTVIFESGTFSFAGESIALIFRQVRGIAIDNSDANAAKNSEQDSNLLDLGEQVKDAEYVILPKIVAPNNTVTNRSLMPDLSQDLGVRWGKRRIQTQQVFQLFEESGPSGQPVWGTTNDKFNQIRFVGGGWTNITSGYGNYPSTGAVGDYIEITFYGTSLNALSFYENVSKDWRVSVDGGAEGSNVYSTVSSAILSGRNYANNQIIPIVSNLTLGIHTVKIRINATTGGSGFYGFEILNETATIRVNPGSQYVKGKKRTLANQDLETYNSGFESGTLGTRGGRVAVYQKADGTIAKAVTPTDASSQQFSSASHANEEVARVYHWREFGAGRSDDFSLLTGTASNRVFTLDDGSTSLSGRNVQSSNNERIGYNTVGDFMTLTFIGTGLDVIAMHDNTGNMTINIDGGASQNYPVVSSGGNSVISKIVSGLPYGTHNIRFTRQGSANLLISQFIVYQPKTPTVPTGSKLIGTYNIPANFVANTTQGVDLISTGVIRKASIRESVYVNGTGGTSDWAISLDPDIHPTGTNLFSDRQNAFFRKNFFGIGFDYRFRVTSASTTSATVSLFVNGTERILNTTNFRINGVGTPTYGDVTVTTYGTGVVFTAASGSLDMADAATQNAGMTLTGLSLGTYDLKVLNNNAGQFLQYHAVDEITPIHSHAFNGPFVLQNTLALGDNGIIDAREFNKNDVQPENTISHAIGVTGDPTTSSSTPVPMPDMSVTHYSKTGKIKISYSTNMSGISAEMQTRIYVDGNVRSQLRQQRVTTGSPIFVNSDVLPLKVGKGAHKIDVYWSSGGGTPGLTANSQYRILLVEDVE